MTNDMLAQCKAAIRAARERSNAAIARHDAEAAATELAQDCIVIASTGALVLDRARMRAAFARAFAQTHFEAFVREPDRIDIAASFDTAAEQGRWWSRWHPEAQNTGALGNYLARWSLRDGRWLIQSELFIPLAGNVQSRA